MRTTSESIRLTLLAVALGALSQTAVADNGQTQMPLPRVEHGQLVSPMPSPTPSTSYPRIQDGRLQINSNVSVSGTITPPSLNVQVPLPEKGKP